MENAEHLRMMAKRALALAIETTDNPELVESLVVMAGQYLEQVAALELAREAAQPTQPADRPVILIVVILRPRFSVKAAAKCRATPKNEDEG